MAVRAAETNADNRMLVTTLGNKSKEHAFDKTYERKITSSCPTNTNANHCPSCGDEWTYNVEQNALSYVT